MTKLSDKIVWITGASSGIGEAIVYQLAQQGVKLIISSRRTDALETVKAACPAEAQNDIHILDLDLSQPDTLTQKADTALDIYGRIDVLVHSGGISQRSMVVDTEIEVYRKLMEVDYFSTVILTKAVLPSMITNGGGHIIVLSSLTGKFGSPYRSGYAAAKHALHGFYDSLRAEQHDNGIKVTIVTPGFIKTNVSINAVDAEGSKINVMDEAQAKGMSAEDCAKKIIQAAEQDKLEVVIGGRETMGIYIKRFFPNWFASVIRKMKVR